MSRTNFEHLLDLDVRRMAESIWNYVEDTCAFCPLVHNEVCGDRCAFGFRLWLEQRYIPTSDVWKENKK